MPDKTEEVSEIVIKRMFSYLRVLEELKAQGIEVISVQQLEEKFGFKASQFRKDLSRFGEFGVRELVREHCEVNELLTKLNKILKLNKEKKAILVGGGNIGTALVNFNHSERDCKVKIEAVFDNDQERVGAQIGELEINPISRISQVVKEINPEIGIVAVPNQAAQEVVNLLIENGIKVLLNFASVHVEVPEEVYLQNIDLTLEMRKLLYYSD